MKYSHLQAFLKQKMLNFCVMYFIKIIYRHGSVIFDLKIMKEAEVIILRLLTMYALSKYLWTEFKSLTLFAFSSTGVKLY